MPKIKIRWIIAGLAVLVIAIWESPLVPQQAMYCEREHTRDEYCATDYVTLVALREVGKALDEHGEAITALFTVVLAISTIMLWKVTERLWLAGEAQREHAESAHKTQTGSTRSSLAIAQQSADLAVVSQRPWVSLECKISDPVVWNRTLIQVTLEFAVKNTGSTPALDVWINTDIRYSGLAVKDPRVRLRQIADTPSGEDRAIGATTLFPNEKRRTYVETHLMMDDIASQFHRAGQDFDPDTDLPYVTATIFGVVNYKVAFNGERHQTGVIYDLTESSGKIGKWRTTADHGQIELDLMTLSQNWAGFTD